MKKLSQTFTVITKQDDVLNATSYLKESQAKRSLKSSKSALKNCQNVVVSTMWQMHSGRLRSSTDLYSAEEFLGTDFPL
jgi:hypothetical protein